VVFVTNEGTSPLDANQLGKTATEADLERAASLVMILPLFILLSFLSSTPFPKQSHSLEISQALNIGFEIPHLGVEDLGSDFVRSHY
jgi:hypothetical protein